jgi:putative hemolysin|tara:strand:- start:925 stop:2271 length:1347 start_codon:yes stop_codon:yes gene_type:complete
MTVPPISSLIDPLVSSQLSGNSSEIIVLIVIVGVLLLISALISGSEAAFFSLNPTDKESLKTDESKKGKLAFSLVKKPQELLATILITNNFVNVGIVILSSSVINQILPNDKDSTFHLIIEVFVITLILLLIGEVIPKIYATKNALSFSKVMAGPLNFLSSAPPISWIKTFLVNGSNFIHKRAKKKGVKISSDELEQALALTKEENTSDEEHRILEGIVKFGNTEVRQIMRPRMDVVAIDKEWGYEKIMELILESGYSRIPVYDKSFDNVVGLLYIKDILPFLSHKEKAIKWFDLIRLPFFIPENKKIDDLLKEFQSKKMHMAVVVDEYGGASGICTLEDVLEEIVGDITDEFDTDEIVYTKIDDQTYRVEGKTALVDVYKVLDVDGKEFEEIKGDAETLGGFLVENAGRILKNNESFMVGETKLVVEASDKRRIKMVRIITANKTEE